MPGYHNPPQRKDRTYAAHGSVITYISDRYDYDRRYDLEVSTIETIWIEIKPSKSANILVCTVYRPEEERMPEWNIKFRQEMESTYIENKEIILMGDFNIDLLRYDEVPIKWKDFIDGFSLTQVIEEPTRVTPQQQSLLDHIYVTQPNNIRQWSVPKSGMSDHFPLVWSIKLLLYSKGTML